MREPTPEAPRATHPPLRAAVLADYLMHCRLKTGESTRRRRLMFVPRMVTNPSLRACVLFRLCATAPRWLHWLWRSILMHRYGCDIGPGVVIGPGLELPHPIGIVLTEKVVIGRNVLIANAVGIGGDGRSDKGPVIGDGAVILPQALILGDVHVGAGATVRAQTVLIEDLPAGAVHRR